MTNPRQKHNPRTESEERADAIALVQRAVERRRAAEHNEQLAMRLASSRGVSIREIAEVSDRSRSTIARILDRDE